MATLVDQNGVSCFVDQNGITEFIDQNGNVLTCTAGDVIVPSSITDQEVLYPPS